MKSRNQWSWMLRLSIRPGSRTSIATSNIKMTAGTNQRVAGTSCSGISNGMAMATRSVKTTGSRGSPCGPTPAVPSGPTGARADLEI